MKEALDELAAAEDELSNHAVGAGKRSTQGFGLSAPERRAVEECAIRVAMRHFKAEGWRVEDVGDHESFDLLCGRKGIKLLHVEVKGTTGVGHKVILPKNEVIHARSHKPVALAVVHGVKLKKGKPPKATGGTLILKQPWKIENENLEPLAYYYQV
jgi:hypothetical protein